MSVSLSPEQVFKVSFTKKDSIEELKEYHTPNAYCLDDKGNLIGLTSCENDYASITIPAGWEHLEYLDVSDNAQLRSLTFEAALPKLNYFDVSDSKVEQLHLPVGFEALHWLDVSRNALQSITFGGALPQLSYLDVSGNQLSAFTLPGGCAALRYLYLNDNALEELVFEGTTPSALQILHLRNNKLEVLPENFLLLEELETLYLHGNPLSDLPKEIIAEDERGNSLEKVWDYLQEYRKGTITNNRAKLIIVGNGRVGKTSLYRRLAGDPFNKKEEYTHGVQLGKLEKEHIQDVRTDKLQLRVWDFGGQDIFYATHQFFLSEEAVYVLAWTNEENVKEHRERDEGKLPFDEQWRSCDYWLENIRLHGKDSPIIMVQTHTDKFANKLEAEEAWSKYYDALNLDFSAAKDYGLPQLKDIIADRLNAAVPMLGKEFPKTYENVIQEIERIKEEEPTISRERFLSICKQSKIDKGGEDSLLDYLRKAGLVVYFDKELLREIVYINPNWLTKQVYRLINNDLKKKKGKIDVAYLQEILPAPEYDDLKREQFVELLQKFELIFQPEDESHYVAPQYLPEELEQEEKIAYDMLLSMLPLAFIFRFPKFFPDNVMINFLSRYGPFAKKRYWKKGIYFTSEQGINCAVEYDDEKQCLHVFTPANKAAKLLQNEVCEAFVELSKNANAEISLDGKVFASWQKLNKHAELYAQNPEQQFFAEDGKTSLYVKDFEHFLPLGEHGMGRFKLDVGGEIQEIKSLVVENSLAEALQQLKTITPNHLENNLILLEQRLNILRVDEIKDIADQGKLRQDRMGLSDAILKFCDDLRTFKQKDSTN